MSGMTTVDGAALLVCGAFLLTFPVFLALGRTREPESDLTSRPRSLLLGQWLREWLAWLITPLERVAVRLRLAPELINYVGVGLSLASGAAFASGSLPLGGVFYLLCGAADVLDGRIARARGVTSSYGAFLDSTLDRFAETFVFLGLAWYFRTSPWAALVAVLAVGGSFLVSYTRARGQGLGVDFAKGIMQRAERIVLLSLAGLIDGPVCRAVAWRPGTLLALFVALIGAGSFGTAVYRTIAIGRRLRA
jgi:phosphatidylglycerophosphate synthase